MNNDTINRLRRENPVPDGLPAPPIEPLLARLGPRPSGRRRSRLGQAAAVVGVGVAAAVAVLVVLLGHRHGRTPVAEHHVPSPPPSQSTVSSYLNEADRMATNRDPACGFGGVARPTTTTTTDRAPSQALLSELAVLRRPQTAADRLPAQFHGSPLTWGGVVYVRYIRRARVVDGLSYYLVPGHFAPAPGAIPEPRRCYSEQLAALRTLVASLPSTQREAILRSGAQTLQPQRRPRSSRPSSPYDGVELVTLGPGGGGGTDGISASNLQTQVSIGTSNHTASGLVPDGVASVTLYYATTPSQNPQTIIAKATRKVTATVTNNVYVVNVGNHGRTIPAAVVYRTANGTVLRRFNTNQ